jgi:hypothetical protein
MNRLVEIAPSDRRSLERTPTALRTKLFPGGVDCMVRDFTKRGARLGFDGPAPLGDHIIGVIWSTGLSFEADVCWRTETSIGVRFANRFDLRSAVPPRLAEIKSQWLNRRAKLPRRQLADCPAVLDYGVIPRTVRLS